MTETPDFDLESGEDCAKMCRKHHDRVQAMGFPTIGAALDELVMMTRQSNLDDPR